MTITVRLSLIVMIIGLIITAILNIILIVMIWGIILKIRILLLIKTIITIIWTVMMIITQGQANSERETWFNMVLSGSIWFSLEQIHIGKLAWIEASDIRLKFLENFDENFEISEACGNLIYCSCEHWPKKSEYSSLVNLKSRCILCDVYSTHVFTIVDAATFHGIKGESPYLVL